MRTPLKSATRRSWTIFLAVFVSVVCSTSLLAQAPPPPPRAPVQDKWPIWTTPTVTNLSEGYQVPDGQGVFHGTQMRGTAPSIQLVHVTTDGACLNYNGETVTTYADVIDTSDALFGHSELVSGGDGTLHAFYVKSFFTGTTTILQAFHAWKAPAGPWSTERISESGPSGAGTVSDVYTLAATVFSVAGVEHIQCFYTQLYTIPDVSNTAVLYRWEVGAGRTAMDGTSFNPVASAEAKPTMMATYEGHLIWAVRVSGGSLPQINRYLPMSTTFTAVTDMSLKMRFGRAALFVTPAGDRVITYSDTSDTSHTVAYKVEDNPPVDIPGAIDALVFQDANGTLTRLSTRYVAAPGESSPSMKIAHSVFDATTSSWISETLSTIEHAGMFTEPASPPTIPDWPFFRAFYEDNVGQFKVTLGHCHVLGADVFVPFPALRYSTRDDNLGDQNDLMMIPTGDRGFVNLGNGNFHLQVPLFMAHGHGPVLESSLAYNSLSDAVSSLGRGWSHTFLTRMELFPNPADPTFVVLLPATGNRIVCAKGTGALSSFWLPQDKYGVSLRVEKKGSPTSPYFEVLAVDGTKWTFDDHGRLTDATDNSGKHLTFTYSDNSATSGLFERNLTSVTDGYGRGMSFEYDASNRITHIHDPGGADYVLTYGSDGALASITVPAPFSGVDRQWQFGYYDSTGSLSPLPDGLASATINKLRGALAYVQSPALSALGGGAPGHNNYYLSYSISGDWYGRVQTAWTPGVQEVAGVGPFMRTKIGFGWTRPSEATGGRFVGSYDTWSYADLTDFGTFHVQYEADRCLPCVIDDPVNAANTVITYNARRSPLTITDPEGRVTTYTYSYSDGGPKPPGWMLDTQMSVKMPGEAKATWFEYESTNGTMTYVKEAEGTGKTTLIYDSGSIISIQDPVGSTPSVTELDGDGRVVSQTDPSGKQLQFLYEGMSYGLPSGVLVVGAADSDGNAMRVDYTYNSMGQVLTETHAGLGTTTYEYDGAHRLTKTNHPSGGPTAYHSYGYDPDDALIWVADASGGDFDTRLFYSARGDLTESKDADDVGEKYKTNAAGQVIEVTGRNPADKTTIGVDLLGRKTSVSQVVNPGSGTPITINAAITLNGSGDTTALTLSGTTADGAAWTREIEYHYGDSGDAAELRGLLLWERYHVGAENLKYRHYFYDSSRRLVAEQLHDASDGFFRGTGYKLDDLGNRIEVWQLADSYATAGLTGRKTTQEFDSVGNMTKRTTPGLKSTLYYYDAANRLTKTIDPSGVETETVLTAGGMLIGERFNVPGHGKQMPVKRQYNARGQLWRTSDCVNPSDFVTNSYDEAGRLVGQVGPEGLDVSYFYNALNQLTKQQVRASASTTLTTKLSYDTSGNLAEFFPSPGTDSTLKWTFSRDFSGRILSRTKPEYPTDPAEYTYDSEGNLGRETDEDGNQTIHVYDGLGRLVTSTYKQNVGGSLEIWDTVSREWDVAGNMTAIESTASGIRIEYQYKPDGSEPHLDELRKVTWKVGGAVWKTVRYDYDLDGMRTKTTIQSAGSSDQVIDMTYDPAGRLESVKVNGFTSATYSYTDGFLTNTTLGNGNQIKRYYDKKGRVEEIRHQKGGSQLASVSYQYDKRDRMTQAYYSHRQLRSTFEYNDASWLTSEDHLGGSGAPDYTNTFATVYGGNESGTSDLVSGSPSAYEGAFHLQMAYDYDQRGNRITRTSTTDPGLTSSYEYTKDNRLTSETRGGTSISYGYAKRGDLTTRTIGGATTTFETDHLSRITKVIGAAETWTYKFSPAGQRVMKTRTAPVSGVEEWVLPDGDETLAEYTGASAAAATLSGIYAFSGTDARAARYSAAGVGTYFWADRLGTVLQLTDATGDPIRTTFSDAWGNDLPVDDPSPPATGIADKWSFTGREKDTESGLLHFRARTYDPSIGRFLSHDPVWQQNLYYYANNNPTNLTDPFGRNVTEADQRAFDQKYAEVERLEREMSPSKYGAAYADLLDFSVKLLARQEWWEYLDRPKAQSMLSKVYAKNSWIRGPYGESGKEHMAEMAEALGTARSEFDRFERADEIATVVLKSLDKAGTMASFCLGGGGVVKVLCQKGFFAGVAVLGENFAVGMAKGMIYNAGIEIAAEVAVAAGADPADVEMAVRGLDATMSIINLVQGANFRSKNNRMCFVAGTPVETQDGPKPIEQVREGDWVLAWDEDAGELCWSRVEQTFVTPRQPIWRLTLKLPDGSAESLDCTPGHPFWADGEGWVPACHLQPGQDVATLSGPARVASVAPTGRNRTVYNFEVAGTHCYFVGQGWVLVHNTCTTPYRNLRGAGDAHHVIQHAAVKNLPGYSKGAAPSVRLSGPSTLRGSPHYRATRVQQMSGGGTYAAERRIGYRALRRGGFSESEARQAIGEADDYFRSIGVGPQTPTQIPGTRR